MLAKFEHNKLKRHLGKLTEEQRYVYNIARKLLSSNESVLEASPTTGIFYIKNGLKLIRFDFTSIHFVNGKYSYFFSYDLYLIGKLKTIFYRHKEILINHLIAEISTETKSHLKKIYSDLEEKEKK